ncbi:putative porin [Microbulbifer litoralis]|uniref:putative porin n=1 Tax=Microbulbifer litoralis TaxID=2933965 RepID=UPI0020285E99|nr:putative porin [Microbulbifer sp. GX H0434]
MKFRFAVLPLMVFAATASAESYNSITTATYENAEYPTTDLDTFDIGSKYYFAPLETMGPLKEFEYIIDTTNLYGNYRYTDYDGGDTDTMTLGGEYFAANGFMVGAEVTESDGNDGNTLSAGYLFNPNFLLSVHRVDQDNSDAENYVGARYNHSLGGTDYIGFDFETDDDFDTQSLSSKLFKGLGNETWVAVEAGYVNFDEADNYWNVGAEYYFSKETSVGAGYDERETFDLSVSHFFNRNVAGNMTYATNNDTDVDQFLLGVTVQL